MQLLGPITMDDMIAVFLKAEIGSNRFSEHILARLADDGQPRQWIDAPNTTNYHENQYRRQLLATYRAYVFDALPAHTTWHRASVTRAELTQIRYIDYSYWNELSNHTRMPWIAAQNIQAGCEIFGVSNQNFLEAANALGEGLIFPELIVVGTGPHAPLTVFEGHLRLTAYLLAPEHIPDQLDVIVGFAPSSRECKPFNHPID